MCVYMCVYDSGLRITVMFLKITFNISKIYQQK